MDTVLQKVDGYLWSVHKLRLKWTVKCQFPSDSEDILKLSGSLRYTINIWESFQTAANMDKSLGSKQVFIMNIELLYKTVLYKNRQSLQSMLIVCRLNFIRVINEDLELVPSAVWFRDLDSRTYSDILAECPNLTEYSWRFSSPPPQQRNLSHKEAEYLTNQYVLREKKLKNVWLHLVTILYFIIWLSRSLKI